MSLYLISDNDIVPLKCSQERFYLVFSLISPCISLLSECKFIDDISVIFHIKNHVRNICFNRVPVVLNDGVTYISILKIF